jgi:hypothetical protein
MWPFKKKQKEAKKEIKYTDYTNWEKDIGFLTLIITRKKNITKNYYINIYATQLKETDFIRDEDIQEIIISGVKEVIDEISPSYRNYLTEKYFKDENELIKFITEEFYVDLTSSAIMQNAEKVKNNMVRKRALAVGRQNLKTDQSPELEKRQEDTKEEDKKE